VRKNRIDAIYTNSQKAHLIGIGVGLITGIPVFWHFRDILHEHLLRCLMRYGGLFFAEHIIAISMAVASQFKICGRAHRKVTVVYNALDIDDFEKQSSDVSIDLRKEFGLPLDAKIVASVGQIAEWKGQENLLRAAKELVSRYGNLYFFIVGKPLFKEQTYHTHLQKLVHELGLDEKVYFTGFREDIPAIMREIDILVHTPVDPEPFGRVLIEAMVCSTPVVAFDIGAVREIVSGNAGVRIPTGDVGGLVRGVALLLEDEVRRKEMVKTARNSVKIRFDYPVLIEKIELLLAFKEENA
jgi:glycosyltransferase involved in cell wall biosynthesis